MILPGDVFNQDRLIRSYQNIQNLNFFESPLPPPDTKPANDQGDVDIIFRMKEKRTGSINFGASVGQGTGVGGFIGLDAAQSVRGLQERVAAVAVRPVHQRLPAELHRPVREAVAHLGDRHRVPHAVALHDRRPRAEHELGRVAAVRIPGAGVAVHPVLRVLRGRSGEIQRRPGDPRHHDQSGV